jgi:hypothetical protein
VEPHVDPSTVVMVPCLVDIQGALFQEGIGNLVFDVLLLQDVLVREGNLPVEVLEPSSLAEAEELVMDEAILDVVELVDVIHNCLTFILHKIKCWIKASVPMGTPRPM